MSKELRFLETIKRFSTVQNITDDCSCTRVDPERYQLISTDMLVGGNHFALDEKRYDLIGQKAITVNVSDIYSSGGKPNSVYISLALPKLFSEEDMNLLYTGLNEACAYFNVKIMGGDITSTSGPIVINITVIGDVKKSEHLSRCGARVGDGVFVSGPLGGAKASNYEIKNRYYRILPVDTISRLVSSGDLTSMTDISDGLARSLYDVAQSSKVGFEINTDDIPLAPKAYIDAALNGGEDFHVLFTVPQSRIEIFKQKYQMIGIVTDQRSQIVYEGSERNQAGSDSYGYDHFD